MSATSGGSTYFLRTGRDIRLYSSPDAEPYGKPEGVVPSTACPVMPSTLPWKDRVSLATVQANSRWLSRIRRRPASVTGMSLAAPTVPLVRW